MAVPLKIAVTIPLSTVATSVLSEDQIILSVVSVGVTEAVIVWEPAAEKINSVTDNVIPVQGILTIGVRLLKYSSVQLLRAAAKFLICWILFVVLIHINRSA